MKKTRILRALKKCNSKEFIADRVLSFRDEKNSKHYIKIPSRYIMATEKVFNLKKVTTN